MTATPKKHLIVEVAPVSPNADGFWGWTCECGAESRRTWDEKEYAWDAANVHVERQKRPPANRAR